jgi:hypothetical protein
MHIAQCNARGEVNTEKLAMMGHTDGRIFPKRGMCPIIIPARTHLLGPAPEAVAVRDGRATQKESGEQKGRKAVHLGTRA